MEPESLYDDLITRYLLNEADPNEVDFLSGWMAADEKNRLYVEAMQRTLHLITLKQQVANVKVEEEWAVFRQDVLGQQKGTVHMNAYANPWDPSGEERQSNRVKVYRILMATAVAASIIFLIGFGAGWFSPAVEPGRDRVAEKQKPENKAKIDPAMAVVHHEVNTSGRIKQFLLPDGSEIALSDSSELTYNEPVNGSRRDVYLVGKAVFKVAKNKAKPFTVFSEDISTTAIGTKFTVTANEKERFIRIRLYEGKVVVKSVKGYQARWKKEIFLVPGQELVYDKILKAVTVSSFTESNLAGGEAVSRAKDNPAIPNYDKRSWFMFNNQPLNEIFDALAEMYDAKILYSKKELNGMYFIGMYDKSDSLEKILKQITLLNNLKLTRQNDTFKIEKKTGKN